MSKELLEQICPVIVYIAAVTIAALLGTSLAFRINRQREEHERELAYWRELYGKAKKEVDNPQKMIGKQGAEIGSLPREKALYRSRSDDGDKDRNELLRFIRTLSLTPEQKSQLDALSFKIRCRRMGRP